MIMSFSYKKTYLKKILILYLSMQKIDFCPYFWSPNYVEYMDFGTVVGETHGAILSKIDPRFKKLDVTRIMDTLDNSVWLGITLSIVLVIVMLCIKYHNRLSIDAIAGHIMTACIIWFHK